MSAQAADDSATPAPAGVKRTKPLPNSTYLTAASFAGKIFAFVALLDILRTLPAPVFGNYTDVLTYVGLFGMFTDLGLNTVAVRDLAQDARSAVEYVSNILVLRLALTIGLVVVIVVLAQFLVSPVDRLAVFVFSLSLIPIALGTTFGIAFQYQERLIFPAIINVVSSFLTALGYIVVLALGHHVLGLVAVFTLVNVLSTAASAWFVYARLLRWRLVVDVRTWPSLLARSFPFFVLTMLNTIYLRADMQILKLMMGCAHETVCRPLGEYGAAYRPLDAVGSIFYANINMVMLPLLNRMAVESRAALARVVRIGTTLVLAVGVPIALLTTFFAPQAMHLLAGKEGGYIVAAPALAVVIWAFPCSLVQCVWYNAVYALFKQHVVVLAFAVTAVFNIVFNILLIPHFSYMASAALTVASELLNLLIVFITLRRSLGPLGFGVATAKLGIVAAVASVVLWLLHPLGIVVGLPIGGLVILAGLKLTRLIGKAEREVLSSMPVVGRYAALF